MKVMDILKTETKAGTAFTKSWHKAIHHCLKVIDLLMAYVATYAR